MLLLLLLLMVAGWLAGWLASALKGAAHIKLRQNYLAFYGALLRLTRPAILCCLGGLRLATTRKSVAQQNYIAIGT